MSHRSIFDCDDYDGSLGRHCPAFSKCWMRKAAKIAVPILLAPVSPLAPVSALVNAVAPDSTAARTMAAAAVVSNPIVAATIRRTGSDILNSSFEASPILADLPFDCRRTTTGHLKCSFDFLPLSVVPPTVKANAAALEALVPSASSITQSEADFSRALEAAQQAATAAGTSAAIQAAAAQRMSVAQQAGAQLTQASQQTMNQLMNEVNRAGQIANRILWVSAGVAALSAVAVGYYAIADKRK
jgi:hypothetical protein